MKHYLQQFVFAVILGDEYNTQFADTLFDFQILLIIYSLPNGYKIMYYVCFKNFQKNWFNWYINIWADQFGKEMAEN